VSSRRAQIQLSPEEQRALIESERIVVVSTLGRNGWPHSMPLWYVPRDGEIWIYTYAKSQKVRNLERDARCTLQVETGDTYDQLRGVMLKADAVIHREGVLELGVEIFERYTGAPVDPEHLRAQATKRVGLQFVVREVASWDHRKLAGVY
jgi:PPOX class probable F420-dependent enzyme